MTALTRRAKGFIMKLAELAATPSTITTAVQFYALVLAGARQLLAIDSDGIIYQVSPMFGPNAMSYYGLDDFLNTVTSTTAVASGGAATFTSSLAGAPGILTSTINALNSRVVVFPSSTDTTGIIVGGNQVVFEGRRRTVTVQDATDKWADRWGLGDGTAANDATDGVYFESDRGTNGDNNVRLCCAAGSTRTKTSMGVAPTANTFERWKAIVNTAGTSVQGYLNGTATGSAVTTNIPTAGATGIWWLQAIKTTGTNTRVIDTDYLESYQTFNAPR